MLYQLEGLDWPSPHHIGFLQLLLPSLPYLEIIKYPSSPVKSPEKTAPTRGRFLN